MTQERPASLSHSGSDRPRPKRRALRVPLRRIEATSLSDPPPLPPSLSDQVPVTRPSIPPPTYNEAVAGPHEVTRKHQALSNGGEDRVSSPPEELSLEDAEVLAEAESAAAPPPIPLELLSELLDDDKTEDRTHWFEDFFDADYLRTVQTPSPKHIRRDCAFVANTLDLPQGATLLDLGCGLGLHAVMLAEMGYRVTGVDVSPTMLARSRAEAKECEGEVEFLSYDMRELSKLERNFDAVLCWGTTFGYFDDQENQAVIKGLASKLVIGGSLLLEVANRDHLISMQPNQVWYEIDGSICMEESDFDYRHSRLDMRRKVVANNGLESRRDYSIRLYALHELCQLLESCGFEVVELSGRVSLPKVFFGEHSPNLIVHAKKKGNAVDSSASRARKISASTRSNSTRPMKRVSSTMPAPSDPSPDEGDD